MTMLKNKYWLLDAHCDAFEMRNFFAHELTLEKNKQPISLSIRKFVKESFNSMIPRNYIHDYHITLPRLKQGNVGALFLNVGDFDLCASSKMLDAAYALAAKHPTDVMICHCYADVKLARRNNKLGLILAVEGPAIFQGQIDFLRNWHRLGIRVVNVSHGEGSSGLTQSADCVYKHIKEQVQKSALQHTVSSECYLESAKRKQLYKKEKGLTAFGKLAIKEMQKLNIICDLAHANDATFWEILETSTVKVCATHSNCAALCNHTRNLTDEMMRALAKRNGVMGLCFYGNFIDKQKPSLQKYVEHILHALTVMGSEHVGIGTDYDGVEPHAFMAISNPAHMNDLWESLDKAGVNKSIMQKIAHGNFLDLLK